MKQRGKDAKQIDAELLEQARRTGLRTHRDELIVASLFLVGVVLGSFLAKYDNFRFFREDLEAAGQVALVGVIDEIISRDDIANPTSYSKTAIRNEMLDATKLADLIRFPDGAEPPRIDKQMSSRICDLEADDSRTEDLLDDINDACETEDERITVRLLSEGLLPREVAEQMGVAVSTVYRVRQRLAERMGI